MKKRLKGLGALVLVLAMMLACVVPAMAAEPSLSTGVVARGCEGMGSVKAEEKTEERDDFFVYTPVAVNGYHFVRWYTLQEGVQEDYTTDKEDNSVWMSKYSSGSPEHLYAVFAPNDGEGEATVQPDNRIPSWIFGGSGAGSNPFTDVLEGSWFADAVIDMNARGIMTGTAPDTFSSETAVSRAQLVTALWRLEGQPMGVEHAGFPDVDMDSWYGYAVDWAAAFDIVEGYDGLFHPEAPVTREQMAAILYRYTQYVGGDMLGAADLSGYTDAGDISDYAAAAMQWAVAQGLMEGSNFELSPKGTLTRAQMAVILSRYLSK